MYGQKANIGKMMALRDAGWEIGKIAGEMHMDSEDVEKEIREYMEAREDADPEHEPEGQGRSLRNTKLLLRNFHMLKEHTERSVFAGHRWKNRRWIFWNQ